MTATAVQEELPFAAADEDGHKYHTILEVWRSVLRPAATERKKRITAQWANRIVATHVGMSFSDMPAFKESYFDGIQQLAGILDEIIDEDPECLNAESAEEDAELNAARYTRVLTEWQKAILGWELDWDAASDFAAVEIASIAEIHRMFFDQTGLAALLDQIKFEFDESDQQELAAALEELRASREV